MRNPKNIFFTALVITVAAFALAGLIGQHNDGPWGGLPEWLGTASWITFLVGGVVTLVTGIYLLVHRERAHGATG